MAGMHAKWTRILVPLVIVLALGAASLVAGLSLTGSPGVSLRQASDAETAVSTSAGGSYVDTGAAKDSAAGRAAAPMPEAADGKGYSAGLISAPSMVIKNASIDVRVRSIDAALARVRAAVARHGAEITDVSISSGDSAPQPLAETRASGPSFASLTIRMPADKLEATKADIAKVGTVLTQSSSASDVTQQYVDMDARLKNLKVEEARLRKLFDRATKVSDLLAVEEQLARVRGEIESLQAQVDYLKRQVERATLTVSLSEPGPVVRPNTGGWGFIEAITQGIQAAVRLLTLMISGFIAILPLVAIAAIVWLAIRILRRKRVDASSDASADEEMTD